MRRPAPEALWTVVLVLVLAGAGAGVAAYTLGRDVGTPTAPPQATRPSPTLPDVTPLEPTEPASPSSRGSRQAAPKPPRATASRCPDLSTEVRLRVVSLNIHFGIGPGGFDLSRIASAIRRWDADVVMLQEVDRFRQRSRYLDVPAELARMTGMEVAYGANVRRGRSEYGTATLSRHPIVQDGNTLLPNQPGLEQRGLLRTDVDVDGTVVSVFNTHLQNKVESIRIRQLAAIRPLVQAAGHPAVFGGDLNSGPGSSPLRLARSFARDAWADAGAGAGHTAPGGNPRYRIDYVMYTPPIRAVSASVLPDVLSDHRAVRADLLLSVAGDEVCVPELDGPLGGRSGGGGPGRGSAGRDR